MKVNQCDCVHGIHEEHGIQIFQIGLEILAKSSQELLIKY